MVSAFFHNKKSMRKIFSIMAMCLFAVALYAQDRVVTRFLGIPVDGTKAEMMQKLKAKGFTSNSYNSDLLDGEFNGRSVHIGVITNNNKVYRVGVVDENFVGEADIKIRFNDLCGQFERNVKYRALSPEQSLSDDEDISYGMTVKNKKYDAVFLQKESADAEDSLSDYMRSVWFTISEEYGKYRIIIFIRL